jgi:hypothetical protein
VLLLLWLWDKQRQVLLLLQQLERQLVWLQEKQLVLLLGRQLVLLLGRQLVLLLGRQLVLLLGRQLVQPQLWLLGMRRRLLLVVLRGQLPQQGRQ